MPRLTAERREARRAEIVAAARRCFSRDGFHQTSMPDIAREAGLSTGAFYRYFPGKDDVVAEIAGQAFGMMAGRLGEVLARETPPSVADLVAAVVEVVGSEVAAAPDGSEVPLAELLRCGVQAWGEVLRDGALRTTAVRGFTALRDQIGVGLRRGQAAGTVPADLAPEDGARVVMALAPGFVLQRAAFGLGDPDGFIRAVRVLTDPTGMRPPPG